MGQLFHHGKNRAGFPLPSVAAHHHRLAAGGGLALVSVAGYNADKRTDRIVNAMTQPAQPAMADPRRI